MRGLLRHILVSGALVLLHSSCIVEESSRGDYFQATLEMSPVSFYDGERITLTLRTNRAGVLVRSFSFPEAPTLVQSDHVYPVEGGVLSFTGTASVTEPREGALTLQVEDPVTGAVRSFSLPCAALVRDDPTSLTLSSEAFTTDTGTFLTVEVGTPEENTTGHFAASVGETSLGRIALFAPLPGETASPETVDASRYGPTAEIGGGRLFIRIGEQSGSFDVLIRPAGAPEAGRTVRVDVREDVALRLKGSFSFYGEPGRRGWFGFPGEVTAELVTYRGTGGGSRIERFDSSVGLYSLGSSYDGPLEVDFIVSVSNTARGNHLFAAYEHLAIPWRELIWYDHDWKWTTLPSQLNTLIQERSPKGSVIACESLATLLRRMDGKALEWCTDTWNNHSDPYDESAAFGTFRIDVTRIVYDRERYRLRYVLNLFEVPSEWGGEAPWWAAIPPERSVVIPWND